MKHIKLYEEFVNEGKMGLNTTILASTKDFTWVYQTGKDSSKTAFEINKKLNDLGIPSFISKTTGDTIGIPTKDLQTAFNKVLSKYDNIKQFAYSDGTKIDKNLINESFLNEGVIMSFHYSKKSSEIDGDVKELQSKAQEFIKMARDKDYNISSNDSVLYFPNFTWAGGKQILGPSFGILAGSDTMLVSPIGSDKIMKIGESLLVRFIKDGRIESYNLY
jgi:hypothetical protein